MKDKYTSKKLQQTHDERMQQVKENIPSEINDHIDQIEDNRTREDVTFAFGVDIPFTEEVLNHPLTPMALLDLFLELHHHRINSLQTNFHLHLEKHHR